MRRLLILAFLLTVPAVAARADPIDQAQVVDAATTTVERMKTDANFQQTFMPELAKARAVLIVPALYKGGFFFGGQYGNGVLLARKGDGSWTYPAFYTIEGGSFGFQFGLESSAIILLVMSDAGLNAVLNNQFKFGADAGITVVAVGASVGAATTSNLGADILAYSLSGIGLYGGLSLEGSVLSPRESWDAAYYGRNLSSRAIVLDNAATNSQAEHLRDILAR